MAQTTSRHLSRACPARGRLSRFRCCAALVTLFAASARAQEPPTAAPRAELPFERVQVLVDASGSMRARFGDRTRMEAATEAVRTLERPLARSGAGDAALWAFGARSHRLLRDCRDVEPLAGGSMSASLARLEPRGVSPLVHALERLLAAAPAPAREAWVVVTDGADSCERDPCTWAAEALVRSARPRIYVVGIALEPEDAAALRCLTEATSGYLLDLDADSDAPKAIGRLAALMRDRGMLRVDVRGPSGAVQVQGRVFRIGREEPVGVVRTGRDEELPGGMYRVVLETLPATVLDRVLVLPGGEQTLTVDDLGAIVGRAWSVENEPLAAGVSVTPADTAGAERFVAGGSHVLVRPGLFHVTVEVADSVVVRELVEVGAGELRELSAGGTGWVHARARGLDAADVGVELQSYASGRTSVLQPWRAPVAAPAGAYRALVRTLPPYVREDFTIAPAETTTLALAGLGGLVVDVRGPGGPERATVTLLRPEGADPSAGEPGPGTVLGTFAAGERQVVLGGTYDLLVEGESSHVERGIRVVGGTEKTVRIDIEGAVSAGGT